MVCSMLAKGGTSKKRLLQYLHKVPIRSNKVSLWTFQTTLVYNKHISPIASVPENEGRETLEIHSIPTWSVVWEDFIVLQIIQNLYLWHVIDVQCIVTAYENGPQHYWRPAGHCFTSRRPVKASCAVRTLSSCGYPLQTRASLSTRNWSKKTVWKWWLHQKVNCLSCTGLCTNFLK